MSWDGETDLAGELVATGVAGTATVRAFTYLGETRNGRTLVEVALDVETAAGGSISVVHRCWIPLEATDRLAVGSSAPVLLSSTDPSRMLVEWDALAM